ncbi:EAL domain-containing protein [Hydrogenimonas thermophila]|uniref:Diguanylate cyclase (GGDEF) domain-containing protein n=1 Tax=Hydrogenimonas thermophila TaxID=223786 RepID=A0A1I5P2H7_9BACT|nr:bifunctional diguanylate cyclase/phosphodiesterase [Hydrogenimonas thermophila]WOE69582.1 bifunctional diguanylate cyclase/phosphodiesterase [Hydrogenimonas thermophila]WOE72096.1 bifunctional diguanylate cyclase/phosphodiesterase [Hydrogenimonas thermophila]SFP28232.1 diguanylate cyclase (GGDEF) domain-containing protein [Hydrogenimonas thermophila]
MKISFRFVILTTLFIVVLYFLAEITNYYSGLEKYKQTFLKTDSSDLNLLLRLKKEQLHLLSMMIANDKEVIDAYLYNKPEIIEKHLSSFWKLAYSKKLLYEIHFFKPPAENFYNFSNSSIKPINVKNVRGDIVWVTSSFKPSDHLMVCKSYAGVRSTYPIFDKNGTILGGLSLGAKLEWLPDFLGKLVQVPVFLTYRLEALRYLSPNAYKYYANLGKSWNDWLLGAKTKGVNNTIIEKIDFSKRVQTIDFKDEEYLLTLQSLIGFRGEEIGKVGVLHPISEYNKNFLTGMLMHGSIVLAVILLFGLVMYIIARRLKSRIDSVYKLSEAFRHKQFDIVDKIKPEKGDDEISLIKNDLIELGKMLRSYYTQLKEAVASRTKELEEVRRELESQILMDPELKIPNRVALEKDIKSMPDCKLALIDIYRFKSINDTYGVEVGNQILLALSQRISAMIEEYNGELKLYRSGSDEFVLLGFKDRTLDEFVECLKNIVIDIEEGTFIFEELDFDINIEVHVGVSTSNEFLLEEADIAVHEAENRHIDVYVYDKKPQQRAEEKQNIEMLKAVRIAILSDHIVPYYQPIVDKDGNIIKYESLVRMIDMSGNIVPPGLFLDVVKRSKYYHSLTRVVVQKSFEQFKSLPYAVSINLSIIDLLNRDTMNMIYEEVKRFPEPERIIFELLESESMDGYEEAQRFVETIRSLGAKIAIDDFGTGYSNFSYLATLQPDFIKIDGSLIRNLPNDEKSYQIVKSIVQFSKALGVGTVAEFVSSEEVFKAAKDIGIEQFQGYYFGKPEPELKKASNGRN